MVKQSSGSRLWECRLRGMIIGAALLVVGAGSGMAAAASRPGLRAWATGARSTVAGPVPPRTTATSVTFVSPTTAFVLGTAPCAHRPCTVILQTSDRGRSWRGRPAPRQPVSATDGTGLWGLRFGDPRRGYAYGDGLWVTGNGAASWRRARAPGPIVLAFAAVQDRELVAVTATCRPGGSGCAERLTLSHRPIRAGRWRRVATVGPKAFSATIAVHRNVVWVLAGPRLLVSVDGGRTFRFHAQRCHISGSTFAMPVAITDDGPHTYLLCVGEGFAGHSVKRVYRTSGIASDWTPMGRPPARGDGGELAAGSDRGLVIATASAASWLYRSTDAARHWQTVLTEDDGGVGWEDLGFTTATDGVVIHGPAITDGGSANRRGQLLLTDDGGRTWRVARF